MYRQGEIHEVADTVGKDIDLQILDLLGQLLGYVRPGQILEVQPVHDGLASPPVPLVAVAPSSAPSVATAARATVVEVEGVGQTAARHLGMARCSCCSYSKKLLLHKHSCTF